MSILNGILEKIFYVPDNDPGDYEDPEDYEEEEEEQEDARRTIMGRGVAYGSGGSNSGRYDEEVKADVSSGRDRGKVVQLPTQNHPSNSIIICVPERYEEAQMICGHLKDRSSVLINLEKADKELAQRIVDFISGTIYAIDGDIKKISKDIFAASPSNVDLLSMKSESRDRGRFSFYR